VARRARQRGVRLEQVRLHRGERRDRLPGRARGYWPASARLSAGKFFASAVELASPAAASFFASTRPTNRLGLYVGFDASARIWPLRGSIATIAPPSAYHSSVACACSIP